MAMAATATTGPAKQDSGNVTLTLTLASALPHIISGREQKSSSTKQSAESGGQSDSRGVARKDPKHSNRCVPYHKRATSQPDAPFA